MFRAVSKLYIMGLMFLDDHSEISTTFSQGPTGFLGVATNPLPVVPNTFTSWQVGETIPIPVYIPICHTGKSTVLHRSTVESGLPNIIDSLFINLDNLQLGADFTEEMTFTGYHNISHMTMSFRVACQNGSCGRDCTGTRLNNPRILSCHTTDGDIVCTDSRYDPSVNCNGCLHNLDISTDCSTCLNPTFDPDINCTACLPGYDPSTNCTTCLDSRLNPNNSCTTCLLEKHDPRTDCTQCLPNRDLSTNCTQCSLGWDISLDCMSCLPHRDPSTNCTQCLPNHDPSTNCSTCSCLSGENCVLGELHSKNHIYSKLSLTLCCFVTPCSLQ